MSNQELLLAISNMMDAKLKPLRGEILSFEKKMEVQFSVLRQELRDEIGQLRREVNEIRTEVNELRTEVNELRAEVNELRAEVNELRAEVNELHAEVNELHAEVDGLRDELHAEVKKLRADIAAIRSELDNLKLVTIEHSIIPRLSNIEECYVGTYQRYYQDAEKIEAIENDLFIVKQVVEEHSEVLKKIS